MNKFYAVLIAILMVFALSCKKQADSDDVMEPFAGIAKSRDYSQIKVFYTEDTIAAIDRAIRQKLITRTEGVSIINYIAPGSKWEKVGREVAGDTAHVSLQFTRHPVDNLVGFILHFTLQKENGKWKIDMVREIEQVLQNRNNQNAVKYIEDL